MKVKWSQIPDWLNTVTQVVRPQDGKFCQDYATAWGSDKNLKPEIWVNGIGEAHWDGSDHLDSASLPRWVVDYEEGDTTENSIQQRPGIVGAEPITDPDHPFARKVYELLTDDVIPPEGQMREMYNARRIIDLLRATQGGNE